jgi:peptidoglycan/LPS O-acetylase OafA/YrhL
MSMNVKATGSTASISSGDGKLEWLDLIRFLSALVVVICHCRADTFVEYASLPDAQKKFGTMGFFLATRLGREAVLIFFVLSGYLVLGKTIERLLSSGFDGRRYLVDRVARIYTPLVPALIFTFAIGACFSGRLDWWGLVVNMIGLQGTSFQGMGFNDPLWSLAYEMWFYVLLWAGVSMIVKRINILVVLALVGSFVVFTELDATFLFCWVVGGLFYFYKPKWCKGELIASSFVVAGSFLLIEFVSDSKSLPKSLEALKDLMPNVRSASLISSVACGWFITNIVKRKPSGIWVMVNKRVELGSAFSYTMYLVHFPIICTMSLVLPSRLPMVSFYGLAILLFKVVLCVIFSWLFYLPFEARTMIYKKRLELFLNRRA